MRISDLGKVITGKTPSTKDSTLWNGIIPFVTPGDIQGTKHIFKTSRCISEFGLQKHAGVILPEKAICVSCIGNIGYVGMTTETCITNQQINSIIAYPDHNPDYIYYLIKSLWPFFKHYEGQSTTLSILNKTQFSNIEILDKSHEEEDGIANILNLFDEKIEINNQINDNLQQQARVIFQEWISKKASVMMRLSDIATINPETYSPKDDWSFVNYLDTSSITSGVISEIQYIKLSENKLPSRARRILRKGDIVFSTVRPNQLHYGIIAYPKPNMLGSTGFAVIRSKRSNIPNEIIYLAITEQSFVEQMQQLAEQSVSTFPSIRPTDLDACCIPEPLQEDSNIIASIKTIFDIIAENNEENQQLSMLRDTLLPRLMSGEIDVSAIAV